METFSPSLKKIQSKYEKRQYYVSALEESRGRESMGAWRPVVMPELRKHEQKDKNSSDGNKRNPGGGYRDVSGSQR